MITYNELNLDNNESGMTFSGTYGPKTEIKYKFEDGDSVTLKQGDSVINVINVNKQEDQTYKGTVKEVCPCNSLESEGVLEEVEIISKLENILTCSK